MLTLPSYVSKPVAKHLQSQAATDFWQEQKSAALAVKLLYPHKYCKVSHSNDSLIITQSDAIVFIWIDGWLLLRITENLGDGVIAKNYYLDAEHFI